MNAVVERHRKEIAELCRQFGVERLEIFGSASADHTGIVPGDIDFLVFYPPGHDVGPWMSSAFALESALSTLLDYPVDLVMEKALENRWFRREAAKTRTVIYDARQIAQVA
ncbi:MAG: nucleotidyltransferase family protein [Thermomicrobiales bacterium]